ncbi:MAG: glycosyltransferase, partial [Fusobacteriaceae bacterium]
TPVAAFLGRYAAMKENQKNIIYTAHGFHFYKGAPLKNWCIYYPMELLAARWTDKLITINEEDYKQSLKFKLKKDGKCYKVSGVGIQKEKFVKNNIIFTNLTKQFKKNKDDYIILTLAELNNNKNQIQILTAMKDIIKSNKNLNFFMAGKGPSKKDLEKYIIKNSLKENVFLLGQIEKDLIPELLQLSDLVISASKREGLGLNIIEAITSNKSVLATENRGHKEIIKDKRFLVKIGDTEDLKNKIMDIYNKKININHDISKFYLEEILVKMKDIYKI